MILKKNYINLMRLINKLLFVVIVLACLAFIFVVKKVSRQNLMPSELALADAENKVLGDILLTVPKAKKSYAVKGKYFFNEKNVVAKKTVRKSINSDSFVDNLVIQGIFWEENPKVMIQNMKNSETYYLNKGEMIGDVCTVTQIKRKSVLIGCDDTEYELLF